jgi:hypothetical protein
MRLSEIADPKDYVPTTTDANDFLQQLVLADDLAPSVLSRRTQPSTAKLSDALSIRGQFIRGDLRRRRGASQWSAA